MNTKQPPHTNAITFESWLRAMPKIQRDGADDIGSATVTLKLTMSVKEWLMIGHGAALNGISLEEVVAYLMNKSDYPIEWMNQDYKMAGAVQAP